LTRKYLNHMIWSIDWITDVVVRDPWEGTS
jgi:hypothetical protein